MNPSAQGVTWHCDQESLRSVVFGSAVVSCTNYLPKNCCTVKVPVFDGEYQGCLSKPIVLVGVASLLHKQLHAI